tara:strand:+ start:635 stop:811 length:177 start_codon:yes stop_codon:yes gene_type:complete
MAGQVVVLATLQEQTANPQVAVLQDKVLLAVLRLEDKVHQAVVVVQPQLVLEIKVVLD